MSITRIQRYIALCAIALCLCILAACSSSGNAPTSQATTQATVGVSNTVVIVTSVVSTPGIGPTVILSPTPLPNGGTHSQQVILKDRTLLIRDVSKAAGSDAHSTAIRLTMTLENTGTKAITDLPAYYSLFGTEGDAFGLSTDTTGSFFGSIAANSSRTGTLVFGVPTAATTSLKLFYRSDAANESVFVPFTI